MKRYVFILILILLFSIIYLTWVILQPYKLYHHPDPKISSFINSIVDSNQNDIGDNRAFFYDTNSKSFPFSSRIKAKKIFLSKPLVIWATEWHMTPIKDLADLLSPFGVKVINYNLDPWRCALQDCNSSKNLLELESNNLLDLGGNVSQRFFEAYKNNDEMRSVDVVYCGFPVGVCQMYEPFNKSVLIVATTRYDVGRDTPEAWNKMNEALVRFSKKKQNIIGGNNLYDARYIQYYTGIKTQVLSSFCDYTGTQYTNQIPIYLVLRRRDNGFNDIFFSEFRKKCNEINCTVKLELITHYKFETLSSYKGIIHIPYQLSVMSIFEQYRMNMPMFFPTIDLLAKWQLEHFIMPERSFEGGWKDIRPNASIIKPHPSQKDVPDPKNEWNLDAIRHWIKFADFYQETIMPYVFFYESIENLVNILANMTDKTLWETSRRMEMFNLETKMEMLTKWKKILIGYADSSSNKPSHL